ncbi:MAG: hypothetical protein H0T46_36720 [Deltaproteobacteria bacterium]|nr:hypothetical protein [Deltaproteobacteria bacterium]
MATDKTPDVTPQPTPPIKQDEAVKSTPALNTPGLSGILAQHGANVPAISAELVSAGVLPSAQLAEELNRVLGNAGAMAVMASLAAKPSAEKADEKPPVAATSPATTAEPGAKAEDKAAMVKLPSALAVSPGQTRPAYEVAHAAVKKTFAKMGFSAEGKQVKVVDHTAPKMTDTGFDFTATTASKTDTPEAPRTASFDFSAGLQKQTATSALAGDGNITVNPIAEPTTLIHECVHLFQKGEIGTYLYEPMTELIAAMAFDEMVKDGSMTGAYTFAPDYLPWVLFTKNVLAPKLGWKRLVGYYVGEGIVNKDQLGVELGFSPTSAPFKQLIEALTSPANLTDRIPALTKLINAGPTADQKPKSHQTKGAEIGHDADTAGIEHAADECEKRIAVDKKGDETLEQTALRLKSENKTEVIKNMVSRAEGFLVEAKASKPTLVPQIEEMLEMLRAMS